MRRIPKADFTDAMIPPSFARIETGDTEIVIYETEAELPPPAPPTPEMPPPLNAWDIRKALSAAGLRQAVEDYVAAAPLEVQDAWKFAAEFERNHPLILGAQQALGVTDEQMDALWGA